MKKIIENPRIEQEIKNVIMNFIFIIEDQKEEIDNYKKQEQIEFNFKIGGSI